MRNIVLFMLIIVLAFGCLFGLRLLGDAYTYGVVDDYRLPVYEEGLDIVSLDAYSITINDAVDRDSDLRYTVTFELSGISITVPVTQDFISKYDKENLSTFEYSSGRYYVIPDVLISDYKKFNP